MLVIGTVIGSGIFLVPGAVLAQVHGHVLLALLAWVAGGALSMLGALTFGELSAANPHAGGIYVYVRDCFGAFPAFLFGWALFFAIGGGANAALAAAFSANLAQVIPMSTGMEKLLAAGMIAVVTIVNVRGTRQSSNLQNWMTAVKVGAIVLMAVVLLFLGRASGGANVRSAGSAGHLWSGFGLAMLGVLWAYEGWQYATFSAGETIDPQRNFPRAFFIGLAALVAVYVVANLGYLAALTPSALATSKSAAAAAVATLVGPRSASFVAIAIAFSIFGAANGIILTSSRVYYAMARDGLFFQKLAEIHPRFQTPAFAIISGSAWAVILAATGTFEQLFTYTVFTGWLFYALAAASIFVYRRKRPDDRRPYSVPFYPWTPLLFIAAATALVANTILAQPRLAAIGLGIVFLGGPVYLIWRARLTRKTATAPAVCLLLFAAVAPGNLRAATEPRYADVEQVLEKFIDHEMADKELPALSIALVDDQQVVWSRGFGLANARTRVPATADTVYRAGTASQLFGGIGTERAPAEVATGTMWTLDGRVFDAPPADGLYTTVSDLGHFLSALFSGRAHLAGFEGHRQFAREGSTYGFATSVKALPADKLGVVVITTKNAANAVTGRIADAALKAMLAARQQKPIPEPEVTAPVDPQLAHRIAGRYMRGAHGVDLIESEGKLSLLPIGGGRQVSLRSLGDALIVDSPLSYGEKILLHGGGIVVGGRTLERVSSAKPHAPPAAWTGLIGEYGPDYDILYILEKDQKLWALVDWFEFDPLEQVSANVYRFPHRGLYDGERLVFTRDAAGHATGVTRANAPFPRRKVGPEEGATQLRITPLRPMADLLKEALAAEPPKESGDFRAPDLVELTALDPSIHLEIRYATTNNFLGTVFYSQARAFMQRPAAEALVRALHNLEKLGYGLLIHDAYRPWYVTKMFWDATPDDKKLFVANPSEGSRHNRGCAVDLTLYDLKSGKPVQMVSTYDETTDRAFADYPGGTSLQRWQRRVLRDAMEAQGFAVYPAEWWHFDYRDWRSYPILNVRFENIGRQQ